LRLRASAAKLKRMLEHLIVLAVCAIATVAAVRLLVIYGIEILCGTLKLSSKTKGQIIGYATSLPEFVVVISSAAAGVFDAGFWNIASSNIINSVLFLSAVLAYRQHRELFNAAFLDEAVFGILSVAIPLTLFQMGIDLRANTSVCIGLLGLFVVYKVIDRAANPKQAGKGDDQPAAGGLFKGVMAMVAGVAVILVAGKFLGSSAGVLIEKLRAPAWLVGWVLGFITSIPELASFFEIFRLHKQRGTLDQIHDTQEALDALVASNLCNLGIILPLGAILYMLVT